uniref:Uncharacterized protein n=1 Tax=Fusarium oxysporum (strain Fo5176) TaxID=660025 RepID=A0A0D2Y1E7_FUSOF
MSSATSDIELGQCNTTPLSRIGTSRRTWRFGWPNLAWPSSVFSLRLSLFWNKSAPVMQLPQRTKKDHCFSAVLSGTRIKTELKLLLSSTKH